MPADKQLLSPDAIEVVPRSPPTPRTPQALEDLMFAKVKVCPPEYPRKLQLHLESIEFEGAGPRTGRLNLNPSVSLSVVLLDSNGTASFTHTTHRVKWASTIKWSSNTPGFFVHESSQIRFELNYHLALKKKTKSLGSITLGIPELLPRAPTGTDRDSFVNYRIPTIASSENRSSSDSDRGSQPNHQPIDTGESALLTFSIRDLVASDTFPSVKLPKSP
ncbi:hypothetical protein M413DRAFT_350871 [Hebeloma cylindrosporum]|uniref:Uncharacterized protein n=1 Tax=Hebeloma cylindrosporum TaxID=76867 RepID=A0A0C2XBK5_HEBCY|nr:hypothetical protein M413DRAFT_350871 [Hebeloma cylindrosporum h7]